MSPMPMIETLTDTIYGLFVDRKSDLLKAFKENDSCSVPIIFNGVEGDTDEEIEINTHLAALAYVHILDKHNLDVIYLCPELREELSNSTSRLSDKWWQGFNKRLIEHVSATLDSFGWDDMDSLVSIEVIKYTDNSLPNAIFCLSGEDLSLDFRYSDEFDLEYLSRKLATMIYATGEFIGRELSSRTWVTSSPYARWSESDED